MTKQKHHTVQEAYLKQWAKTAVENQLQIYSIPENKYLERGPKWMGFYKEDYNILDDDEFKYLPEETAARIDTLGIEAIRKINCQKEVQLSPEDRSAIAFYTALQYIRTPRYRDEEDKWFGAAIRHLMKISKDSLKDTHLSKEELLKEKPTNDEEARILKQIAEMSQEEINKAADEALFDKSIHIGLTKSGHSKMLLKLESIAKGLFDSKWSILFVDKGIMFNTSDNPCFVISETNLAQGLLSPSSTVFFPLRPDVCLCIQPRVKTHTERYIEVKEGEDVLKYNELILENSYQCVISKNKSYLENLVRSYDYKNHKKSRSVAVYEKGDYTIFNIE